MTNQDEHQFGFNKKEDVYEKYIDEWVVIRVPGIQSPYAGQMKSIQDGHATLSPFQYGEYGDDGKSFCYKLNESSSLIPLIGSPIESTTRENIENSIKYHNNEVQRDLKRVNEQTNKKSKGLLKLLNSLRNKVL